MNVEIIPNDQEEEEEVETPDEGTSTATVIENIDSIPSNNNDDGDDEGISAAISDDTSATSLASTLSDGISRPRSASRGHTAEPTTTVGGINEGRPSSIPRIRPRSNPRTRTPMRQASPLLVISPPVVVNSEENERLMSSRRSDAVRRARASSIPEEVVHDDVDADQTNNVASITIAATSTVDNNDDDNTNTTTRTAGRFFTQAAVASTTTQRRRNHPPTTTEEESNTQQQQRALSTKQTPSHRKIRRWKNDAFIGTPLEHVHTMLLMGGGADNGSSDKRWNTFPYMPNHPLEYNSEFQKLSSDKTKGGEKVRERFVRGEVASVDVAWRRNQGSNNDGEVGEEARMYQRIVTKCHQMGISSKQQQVQLLMTDAMKWGEVLYNKLGMRIQSVLSRSCSSVDTSASGIVASFESYLVSLALHSGNHTNDDADVGFPPLQSQAVYDVFNDILACPPRIVIRNKLQSSTFSNSNKRHIGKGSTAKKVSDMNQYGVLIPTIHFYFPTEDGQDGSSSKRSSAFHRILLYAVCQFHGLDTSSSFVVPEQMKKKVKKEDNDGRRRGRQKQTQDVKGSMKVVTVQGGVLLAPSVKLLDFVCTC